MSRSPTRSIRHRRDVRHRRRHLRDDHRSRDVRGCRRRCNAHYQRPGPRRGPPPKSMAVSSRSANIRIARFWSIATRSSGPGAWGAWRTSWAPGGTPGPPGPHPLPRPSPISGARHPSCGPGGRHDSAATLARTRARGPRASPRVRSGTSTGTTCPRAQPRAIWGERVEDAGGGS